jgi:hypothetical protein
MTRYAAFPSLKAKLDLEIVPLVRSSFNAGIRLLQHNTPC